MMQFQILQTQSAQGLTTQTHAAANAVDLPEDRLEHTHVEGYHVKNIKNKFHDFKDDGTVELLVGRIHHSPLAQERALTSEHTAIRRIFSERREDLRKIHIYYNDIQTNGISHKNFVSFCEDCHLTRNPSALTTATLVQVFCASVLSQEEYNALSDTERADMEFDLASGAYELSAEMFLQTLLRLAHERYAKDDEDTTLSSGLLRLLDQDVLPHAGRTVVEEFRKALSVPAVRAVVTHFSHHLTSTFRKYARFDQTTEEAEGALDTLNMTEWKRLAFDARLSVSDETLETIFVNVQQDEEFGDDDPDMADEMSYQEFVEALAACAMYRVRDPFLSLARKLEIFFQTFFVTNLGNLKPKPQRRVHKRQAN
jgi:hypothetical protein